MKRKAFRPKKRLGQNFLYDPAIAKRIVDAADVTPGRPVIELGSGKGILTKPLAERGARVIAIEVDRDLFAELDAYFKSPEAVAIGSGVELLNADFTTLSVTALLAERGLDKCLLFGNIPYYLTRDVLFSFLVDEYEMIDGAYIMVQREVGERIISGPGSRTYGITSVILQTLYEVRSLFRVAPGSFFPRPKVGSIVLEFRARETVPIEPGELNRFSSVVKSLFQQRRKTLHKTIRTLYSLNEAELADIGRAADVDLRRRPEELSKEQILRLSRAISEVTAVG